MNDNNTIAGPDNFRKEELTIDPVKAQLHAFAYFIPFALGFGIPFFMLWGGSLTTGTFKNVLPAMPWSALIIIGIFLVGVVVHELIHGITWAIFARQGFSSIRYGVLWKHLTPYCHCKEPLLVKHYCIGGLMPAIILGIIPSVMSLVTGHIGLFLFGMFFTLAAGGDFMIIRMLWKEPMDNLVQDHPEKIGCYIYRPKEI